MRKLLGICMMVLVCAPLARAQTLVLEKSALGHGGGVVSNGAVTLQSTLGQSAIGFSTGGDATLLDGFWQPYSPIASEVAENPDAMLVYNLAQNYPNPFNPTTTIPYSVGQGKPVFVTLAVYDVAGRRVSTLVQKTQPPGVYRVVWNGQSDSGHQVATGIYFYRLTAGNFVQAKKLVLVK